MRSLNVDRFNHDDAADEYDADVGNEADPIRTGYAQTLAWVARSAAIEAHHAVLDLGAGTGNLTALLPTCQRLVAVDASRRMLAIGRRKLASRREIEWVQDDVLGYLSAATSNYDVIVSSYALHHLTEDEKGYFARLARQRLRPGGRCVLGDLAFADADARARFIVELRAADEDELVHTIEDEFFWDLSLAERAWRALGCTWECRRFSQLSWGFLVTAP